MTAEALAPIASKAMPRPVGVRKRLIASNLGLLFVASAGLAFLGTSASTLTYLAPLVPLAAMSFGSRSLVALSGLFAVSAFPLVMALDLGQAGHWISFAHAHEVLATLVATGLASLNLPTKPVQPRVQAYQQSSISNVRGLPLTVLLDTRGNVTKEVCGHILSNISLAGRGLIDNLHLLDRVPFLNALARLPANGSESIDLRLRVSDSKNGVWRHFRCELNSLSLHSGAVAMAVFNDTSGIRSAESELHALKEKKDEEVEHLRSILAVTAHTLKNNLTSLLGFGELLRGQGQAENCVRTTLGMAAAEIALTVEAFGALVDQEPTTCPVETQDIVWRDLIGGVLEKTAELALAHDVIIKADRLCALPDGNSDKAACHQVLVHLLAQAIRSSKQFGTVHLATHQHGRSVQFIIQSEGKALSTDAGEELQGLDSLSTAALANSDLGTRLVKKRLEALRGSIRCNFKKDRNSKITVTLPLKLSQVPVSGLSQNSTQHRPFSKEPQHIEVDNQGEYCARLSA